MTDCRSELRENDRRLLDMAAMAANTLLRIIDGEHVDTLRLNWPPAPHT
ncbi:hypothetical protein [Streptomyces sp. NRRL WC-3549]|nr:hypothetical protein [Streptomyces sp. NRRL WC-3549]